MQLVKMTSTDFDLWLARRKKAYALDKEKANKLTPKEAWDIAERDFASLLPEGLNSKDSFLYVMKDRETSVGYLWFCIRGAEDNRKAFLYDIIVEEEHRGKKFGKKAMLLLEDEVKKLGLSEIGLHVFGYNETAIQLYRSLGYGVTDLVMSKTI